MGDRIDLPELESIELDYAAFSFKDHDESTLIMRSASGWIT